MKRKIVLQPLSRQHHSLLLAVLFLKKGIAKNTDGAVLNQFVLQMWEEEIEPHFHVEEKLLIPAIIHLVPAEIIEKIIFEHKGVKDIIDQIKHQPDKTIYQHFADQLELNIRNEERIYFNIIQEEITESLAQLLSSQIVDTNNSCIHFRPPFWE